MAIEFIGKLDDADNLVICDMARTLGFVISAQRLADGITPRDLRERLESLELAALHRVPSDA